MVLTYSDCSIGRGLMGTNFRGRVNIRNLRGFKILESYTHDG